MRGTSVTVLHTIVIYRNMKLPIRIVLLAALFVLAGLMHFLMPGGYVSIMPPWVPWKMQLVYLSGVLEIAGGIGLLISFTRKWAAIGLIALLIVVFPANIQMLLNGIEANDSLLRIAALWLRLPLQPLLIIVLYRIATSLPSRRAA